MYFYGSYVASFLLGLWVMSLFSWKESKNQHPAITFQIITSSRSPAILKLNSKLDHGDEEEEYGWSFSVHRANSLVDEMYMCRKLYYRKNIHTSEANHADDDNSVPA